MPSAAILHEDHGRTSWQSLQRWRRVEGEQPALGAPGVRPVPRRPHQGHGRPSSAWTPTCRPPAPAPSRAWRRSSTAEGGRRGGGGPRRRLDAAPTGPSDCVAVTRAATASIDRRPFPGGVIGNTTGSGPVIRGSSPCPGACGAAAGTIGNRRSTAPSSSGLGHHPLKVAARVRIPLGLLTSLDSLARKLVNHPRNDLGGNPVSGSCPGPRSRTSASAAGIMIDVRAAAGRRSRADRHPPPTRRFDDVAPDSAQPVASG